MPRLRLWLWPWQSTYRWPMNLTESISSRSLTCLLYSVEQTTEKVEVSRSQLGFTPRSSQIPRLASVQYESSPSDTPKPGSVQYEPSASQIHSPEAGPSTGTTPGLPSDIREIPLVEHQSESKFIVHPISSQYIERAYRRSLLSMWSCLREQIEAERKGNALLKSCRHIGGGIAGHIGCGPNLTAFPEEILSLISIVSDINAAYHIHSWNDWLPPQKRKGDALYAF